MILILNSLHSPHMCATCVWIMFSVPLFNHSTFCLFSHYKRMKLSFRLMVFRLYGCSDFNMCCCLPWNHRREWTWYIWIVVICCVLRTVASIFKPYIYNSQKVLWKRVHYLIQLMQFDLKSSFVPWYFNQMVSQNILRSKIHWVSAMFKFNPSP